MHQIDNQARGGKEMGRAKPEDAINIIAAGLIKYSVHVTVEKSVSKLITLSQKTKMHRVGGF